MSAIQVFLLYINHSEFSCYIKHCPLLGRGPLLGASVNGELTVHFSSVIIMLIRVVLNKFALHRSKLLLNLTFPWSLRPLPHPPSPTARLEEGVTVPALTHLTCSQTQ